MTNIEIVITRKYLGNSRTKVIYRQLPTQWADLKMNQFIHYFRLKQKKYVSAANQQLSFLYSIVNLKPWHFFRMKYSQAAELLASLTFLDDDFCFNEIIVSHFKCGIKKYYGPQDGFENCSVIEMAWASKFFKDYYETSLELNLDLLIACLYRPASIKSYWQNKMNKTDIRNPFNLQLVETSADKIKKIPMYVKQAIYHNYAAVHAHAVKIHKPVFDGKATEDPFGWSSVIIGLSGEKLGTVQEVERMPYRLALIYLHKSLIDQNKMENSLNAR